MASAENARQGMPNETEIATAIAAASLHNSTRDPLTQEPAPWPIMVRGWVVPTDPPRYAQEQIDQAWQRIRQRPSESSLPIEALWPELPVEHSEAPGWEFDVQATAKEVIFFIKSPDEETAELIVWRRTTSAEGLSSGYGFHADSRFVDLAALWKEAS